MSGRDALREREVLVRERPARKRDASNGTHSVPKTLPARNKAACGRRPLGDCKAVTCRQCIFYRKCTRGERLPGGAGWRFGYTSADD